MFEINEQEIKKLAIEFSDGMKFNTQTGLHIERRSDGYYVVGNGMLIPVNDREEGIAIIDDMKEPKPIDIKKERSNKQISLLDKFTFEYGKYDQAYPEINNFIRNLSDDKLDEYNRMSNVDLFNQFEIGLAKNASVKIAELTDEQEEFIAKQLQKYRIVSEYGINRNTVNIRIKASVDKETIDVVIAEIIDILAQNDIYLSVVGTKKDSTFTIVTLGKSWLEASVKKADLFQPSFEKITKKYIDTAIRLQKESPDSYVSMEDILDGMDGYGIPKNKGYLDLYILQYLKWGRNSIESSVADDMTPEKLDFAKKYIQAIKNGEHGLTRTRGDAIVTTPPKKENINSKFLKAIEIYSGKRPTKIEIVEDPKVQGTYAIRSDGDQDWLVIHYNDSWTPEQISEHLEEAEFDTWPPVSGEPKFFI